MKKIVILYSPGSYGSFVSWMIERFNTARMDHHPKIVDDPLTANGSSHAYASLCKIEDLMSLQHWIKHTEPTPWGYSIWAGWPITNKHDLQTCIDTVLSWLDHNGRVVLISRVTEQEALISWLNAGLKLDTDRLLSMLDCRDLSDLDQKLQETMDQRHFRTIRDPRFIEISVNDIHHSDPGHLLSVISMIGLSVCDHEHFEKILIKQRRLQKNIDMIMDGSINPLCGSVRKYLGQTRG